MATTSLTARTKKAAAASVAAALIALGVLAGCGAPAATQTTTTAPTATAAATTGSTAAVITGNTTAPATTGSATTAPASTNNQAAQPAPTTAATNPDQGLIADSNTTVSVVKRVEPAVVTIYNQATIKNPRSGLPNSRTTPSANGTPQTQGIGSGFIVSTDGYIVTNAHVVQGQTALQVVFADGVTTAPAKLIGADTKGDIAVIKVDVKVPGVLQFGDSTKLSQGETVLAIGSALGDYRNSITKGVVSGLNRQIPDDPNGNIYVQTDAAINHGNSGGPLVNLNGEVVAINTAVVRSTGSSTGSLDGDVAEGLGFSIPSNAAKLIADQIIATGTFARPFIGIQFQTVTPAIIIEANLSNGETGAVISKITASSPASKAGLQANDVIKSINGTEINDDNPLGTLLLQYKPGDTITLNIVRNKQPQSVKLTLAQYPANSNG